MGDMFTDSILAKNEDGETCKTCIHREPWECGSKTIQYCGKLTSNRTQNGKKKILCKTEACYHYKKSV